MKNNGSYFIVWQGITKEKYYPPEVHPFDWKGIELFVHKVMDGVEKGKALWSTKFYQVSEKTTGASAMLLNISTIVDAKTQAIERFNKIGVDDIRKAIAKVK